MFLVDAMSGNVYYILVSLVCLALLTLFVIYLQPCNKRFEASARIVSRMADEAGTDVVSITETYDPDTRLFSEHSVATGHRTTSTLPSLVDGTKYRPIPHGKVTVLADGAGMHVEGVDQTITCPTGQKLVSF